MTMNYIISPLKLPIHSIEVLNVIFIWKILIIFVFAIILQGNSPPIKCMGIWMVFYISVNGIDNDLLLGYLLGIWIPYEIEIYMPWLANYLIVIYINLICDMF